MMNENEFLGPPKPGATAPRVNRFLRFNDDELQALCGFMQTTPPSWTTTQFALEREIKNAVRVRSGMDAL